MGGGRVFVGIPNSLEPGLLNGLGGVLRRHPGAHRPEEIAEPRIHQAGLQLPNPAQARRHALLGSQLGQPVLKIGASFLERVPGGEDILGLSEQSGQGSHRGQRCSEPFRRSWEAAGF